MISKAGLDVLKRLEGKVLTQYRCSAGVLTIGYGHAILPNEETTLVNITDEEATKLLTSDVRKFASGVMKLLPGVQLTQNEIDALTIFAFNVGLGNLKQSTLLRKLGQMTTQDLDNEDNAAIIAAEFLRWNKAAGKKIAGLVYRRTLEASIFMGLSKPINNPDLDQVSVRRLEKEYGIYINEMIKSI